MLTSQILFFFSAIGVFNAILLCAYLFFDVKNKGVSHYLLATLLLLFCVRVGISCIYFFEKNLSPYWIQLGLSAHFMIGPVIYVYTKVVLSEKEKLTKNGHLNLWMNGIFIVSLGLFYTFKAHPRIWDYTIRSFIHFYLTIYLVLTAIQLLPILKKWLNKPQKLAASELNVAWVFLLTITICTGFVVSLYTNYVIGPVFTSFLFYLIIFWVIFNRAQLKTIFYPTEKYVNKKIAASEATELFQQLEKLMQEEKLYQDPLLKLEVLSKKMKITDNKLSQLLNDNLGKSYATYISEYRIQAAKHLLVTNTQMTIEAIGYEVGFNSKTSFYTTFKKQTGLTPSAFKKQLTPSN